MEPLAKVTAPTLPPVVPPKSSWPPLTGTAPVVGKALAVPYCSSAVADGGAAAVGVRGRKEHRAGAGLGQSGGAGQHDADSAVLDVETAAGQGVAALAGDRAA